MSDFVTRRKLLKSLAVLSAVAAASVSAGIAYATDSKKKARKLEKLIEERDRKIEKAGDAYERDVSEAEKEGKPEKLEKAEAKYEAKVRAARRIFKEKRAKLEGQ